MKTSFVALCVAAIASIAAASNQGIMTNFKALDVEECGKFHYAFSYAVRLSPSEFAKHGCTRGIWIKRPSGVQSGGAVAGVCKNGCTGTDIEASDRIYNTMDGIFEENRPPTKEIEWDYSDYQY